MSEPQRREIDFLLTTKDVLKITGFRNRVSLWRKSRNENDPFPRPLKDGHHFTRWRQSDIEKWMNDLEVG